MPTAPNLSGLRGSETRDGHAIGRGADVIEPDLLAERDARRIAATHYEWDTRSAADGRYEVKVVASDNAATVHPQVLAAIAAANLPVGVTFEADTMAASIGTYPVLLSAAPLLRDDEPHPTARAHIMTAPTTPRTDA